MNPAANVRRAGSVPSGCTRSWIRSPKETGRLEDIDELEELAYYIKDNALCGLGQTAPNPVLSTLRYFKDEYIAHVTDKKCPAKVCKDLLVYKIDPEKL